MCMCACVHSVRICCLHEWVYSISVQVGVCECKDACTGMYICIHMCACVCRCVCVSEKWWVCAAGVQFLYKALREYMSGVFRDIVGCLAHGPDYGQVAVPLSSYPAL